MPVTGQDGGSSLTPRWRKDERLVMFAPTGAPPCRTADALPTAFVSTARMPASSLPDSPTYFTSFRVASGALEQVGAHVAREPEHLSRADQEGVS